MKKILLFIVPLLFLFVSCEDKQEKDCAGVEGGNNICGCTVDTACNYNPDATKDDGSCEYLPIYYDCDGNCLYDEDEDGICDNNDGDSYETVQIDDQLWMAENLKVTHYRNGSEIPNLTNDNDWTHTISGAYCVYDNNESNADTYGYLYNWSAVVSYRNIAPEGWHVPTDEEIKKLEMYFGMCEGSVGGSGSYVWSDGCVDNSGGRGTNEGSKLAGRADLWLDGDLENPD